MKIKVKDMTCKHCVMKIEKALMMDNLKAKVTLDDQSVSFANDNDKDKIMKSIEKAGYTPSL